MGFAFHELGFVVETQGSGMETQYKERVDCDVTTWERGLIWVCGLYAVSTLIARTQRPFSNFPPPFLRVLLAPAVIPSNFHHQPPFSIYTSLLSPPFQS